MKISKIQKLIINDIYVAILSKVSIVWYHSEVENYLDFPLQFISIWSKFRKESKLSRIFSAIIFRLFPPFLIKL